MNMILVLTFTILTSCGQSTGPLAVPLTTDKGTPVNGGTPAPTDLTPLAQGQISDLPTIDVDMPSNWIEIVTPLFTFQAPPNTVELTVQGYDSLVLRYDNAACSLHFDFGIYNENPASPDESIDGKAAKIGKEDRDAILDNVSYTKFSNITFAKVRPEDSSLAMHAFCKTEQDQALTLTIFRSILFNRGQSPATRLSGKAYRGLPGQGGTPSVGCEGCGSTGEITFLDSHRVEINHPGNDAIYRQEYKVDGLTVTVDDGTILSFSKDRESITAAFGKFSSTSYFLLWTP